MRIRRFVESDAVKSALLYCSCFAEPPWLESFDWREVKDEMMEVLSWPKSVMLVATVRGDVIGVVYGYPLFRKPELMTLTGASTDAFYLAEAFVAPSHRGRGIATKLIKEALASADEQADSGVARTSVDQPIIQHLLMSLGWKVIARQEVFSEKMIGGKKVVAPDNRVILFGKLR